MERVFIDTSALYPISLCDVLLRLAEVGIHDVLWTDALLEELADRLVARGRRSHTSARGICDGIRRTFPEGRVPEAGYAALVDDMPGPDPADRCHTAAALAGEATVLVTADRTGFPPRPLAKRGLRVLTPDTYLRELLAAQPDEVLDLLEETAADKANPPLTVDNVLDALGRAGAVTFARQAGRLLRQRHPDKT